MKFLQRALIEKAGNDHGFEYVLPGEENAVHLASARHRARVRIASADGGFELAVLSDVSGLLSAELARSFPDVPRASPGFIVADRDQLARLLRRTAELARALPNQAEVDFETRLKAELARLPDAIKGTEVERLVRQRVGQQAFRSAMLDYWGGTCAVTGIAIPEVLRASHAKPWAECDSDAERLDVFNGFLLSANLDALFDKFLICFSSDGALLVSSAISPHQRERLGLNRPLRLRWLATGHLDYLQYHRVRFGDCR